MPPSRRILCAVALGVIAAALYVRGLGRAPLWEPDEGRYAEIAREMAVSGDYVTPRDDGLRYFEKPPLVYWCDAAALSLFGKREFAVRLPAALFTAGEVAVTFAIADLMFDTAASLLAGAVLILSPLVFAFALFATLDPALAFFLTAGLGAFYAASREPDLGAGDGRLWMIVAAALLALGTLSKGPVALVLGGAIALVWLVWERRAGDLARFPFFTCAAVYAAIVAPWFILAELRNPGFLHFFLVHEHLQRYLQSQEHGWGPWFFVPIVVAGAWPWLYFVPPALSGFRQQSERASAIRFLLVWFAVIFVFFSIPRSKLGSYILPAMPPIAIVAGLGLSSLRNVASSHSQRTIRNFAIVNGILLVVGAIVIFGFLHDWLWPGVEGLIAAVALCGAAIGCAALVAEFRPPWLAVGLLAASTFIASFAATQMRNDLSERMSYRSLASAIQPYLNKNDCLLGSYRHYEQALPFYTGKREVPVEYLGEIAEFEPSGSVPDAFITRDDRLRALWSSRRCFILIANRSDFASLASELAPRPIVLGCEGKKLALGNLLPPGFTGTPADCSAP